MASNHELGLQGKQFTPALELAYPAGDEAGLPLSVRALSAQNSTSGAEASYIQYDHHATGTRGYTHRFSVQPRSDNSSSLLQGSQQYLELELPPSMRGVIKRIACELNVDFSIGTSGTVAQTLLPTDMWLDRVELRGGGSAGSVLETVRGNTAHQERKFRHSETEIRTMARDLGWGETDSALFAPATSYASGGQASISVDRRVQIDLITPLTDAQVYAPSLNLGQHPMTVRVYFKPTAFSSNVATNPATLSVSASRFWIEEHVLNEADAVAAAQVMNDRPVVYRCLARTEFQRSKGNIAASTEYNDVLLNLHGLSAGLMVYLKPDSEADADGTVSSDTGFEDGPLAEFRQLSAMRLLDRQNGPIIEEETDEINRLVTQKDHLAHAHWYNDSSTIWYSYLIPFCDDFGSALHGTHTGARMMTGDETFYYTTAAAVPTVAAALPFSLNVTSYDYAALVCRRGAAPQYIIARGV